jgi:drug/metabolite transporter (DMT)-like permease
LLAAEIGKSFLMSRLVPAPREYQASTLAIWSALLAVYLIWGSTYLAIRFAVETTPPFLSAAFRFIVSGAFLYIWRRAAGDPKPTVTEWHSAATVGIFLLLGGNGGVVWASQFIPSSLAALLVATVPLWMVAIDSARPGKQRPSVAAIIGILIGFGGVVLLIRFAASDDLVFNLFGTTAVLFASLSWAIGSLYARTAKLAASPLLATGMEMFAGGVALLVIATAFGEWNRLDISAISSRSALALAYLTAVGSAAFVAYAWLLRVAPTPLVATYAYVNPLVAVLLGYLLANEPMTARTLFAASLIIGSVVLVSAPKR